MENRKKMDEIIPEKKKRTSNKNKATKAKKKYIENIFTIESTHRLLTVWALSCATERNSNNNQNEWFS